jgi:collagenase-like PrtC family protease
MDPDGMGLETLEGEPFLAVNGTQTLSHAVVNLLHDLDNLRGAGIRCLRLSPHKIDMVKVATTFREVLDGRLEAPAATQRLSREVAFAELVGGFHYDGEGVGAAAREG